VQVRVLDLRGTTLLFAPISGIPAGGLAYMTLGRAALVDIEASRKRLDPPPNAAAHRRSSREQPRHEGDSQRREPVARGWSCWEAHVWSREAWCGVVAIVSRVHLFPHQTVARAGLP
jgi:hypothetical protein